MPQRGGFHWRHATLSQGWPLFAIRGHTNRGLFMLRFLAGSIAAAADMPAKAPAYKPPVGYNWSGFYFGGHIGYGWGSDPVEFSPLSAVYAPAFAAGNLPTSLADNARGVIGGIQYGTNWQFD